jgi:hypothetical protein
MTVESIYEHMVCHSRRTFCRIPLRGRPHITSSNEGEGVTPLKTFDDEGEGLTPC